MGGVSRHDDDGLRGGMTRSELGDEELQAWLGVAGLCAGEGGEDGDVDAVIDDSFDGCFGR